MKVDTTSSLKFVCTYILKCKSFNCGFEFVNTYNSFVIIVWTMGRFEEDYIVYQRLPSLATCDLIRVFMDLWSHTSTTLLTTCSFKNISYYVVANTSHNIIHNY